MGRKLANTKQKYPQPINQESTKVIRLKFQPQAKTLAQELYLESLREAPLTIGTGPAGSGKSFLAMAVGIEKLLSNEVSKIVLTRPICEAGENLGFLPGTFEEKISPYLRPLLDAMEELVGVTMAKKLLDGGKVEFAPLAYMRGRTFNNSYVILDEAQNTTIEQIKLFVTRAGNWSTFVVNGDVTQCDLRGVPENGLEWLARRIRGRSNMVNVVEFGHSDIQRSPLVSELLKHLDGPDTERRERSAYRRAA
jgi:phosphate starvation-inducible protein PhoH and related proteins